VSRPTCTKAGPDGRQRASLLLYSAEAEGRRRGSTKTSLRIGNAAVLAYRNRGPMVRIHLPPAVSHLRTWLSGPHPVAARVKGRLVGSPARRHHLAEVMSLE
jgi:hypothetical protein